MSDKEKNYAFACAAENGYQSGMTLRDYFAGQALAGILARSSYKAQSAALFAYQYADAMLAEREKETPDA